MTKKELNASTEQKEQKTSPQGNAPQASSPREKSANRDGPLTDADLDAVAGGIIFVGGRSA